MSTKIDIPMTAGLIKLEDWRGKKEGESIPFTRAADFWEVSPAVGTDEAWEGNSEMLPALFLQAKDGSSMGCTFSAGAALEIADYLISYSKHILHGITEAELKRLEKMSSTLILENAYAQVRKIVEEELLFEADQVKTLARRAGLAESKVLIGRLAEAASMDDGEEKMQILEELLSQLKAAFG